MKKEYIIELREEEADELMDEHWVSELVRCKDCKYWRRLLLNRDGDGACRADNPIRVSNQNWFCGDGIAKD